MIKGFFCAFFFFSFFYVSEGSSLVVDLKRFPVSTVWNQFGMDTCGEQISYMVEVLDCLFLELLHKVLVHQWEEDKGLADKT